MLLFLSYGKILLPSNDEVRKQRIKGCNDVYKKVEKRDARGKKGERRCTCFAGTLRWATPNRKDALLYAEAITNSLERSMMASTAR